jgi:hypothetical protein
LAVREAGSPGRDAVRYAKLPHAELGRRSVHSQACSRAAGARQDPLGVLEDGQDMRTLSFSEALMHATILVALHTRRKRATLDTPNARLIGHW